MKIISIPFSIFLFFICSFSFAQTNSFKALVMAERGEQHEEFVKVALDWLEEYSKTISLDYVVINHAESIDTLELSDFDLIIQLNYPPYKWTEKGMEDFQSYIDEGKGSWIGLHHATLLGEFDGYPMWNWFSDFMGGIRFKNYIANKATGTVYLEKPEHPVFKGLPKSFQIPDDEWYVFDKNPREQVNVLANVDENSYNPPSEIKMGDHPVIWENPDKKAKNIYFLIGHDKKLLSSNEFKLMLSNAILWALEDDE